jgi:hypothetical protein
MKTLYFQVCDDRLAPRFFGFGKVLVDTCKFIHLYFYQELTILSVFPSKISTIHAHAHLECWHRLSRIFKLN